MGKTPKIHFDGSTNHEGGTIPMEVFAYLFQVVDKPSMVPRILEDDAMPPARFTKPADALDLLKLKDNASRQALIKYLEELQRADPGVERRRDARVHLETIENATLLIKSRDSSQRFVAMMYDLSTKGVGVIHGGFLHLGTLVTVTATAYDGQQLSLSGTVAHCSHIKARAHLIGIKLEQAIDVDAFLSALIATTPSFPNAKPSSADANRSAVSSVATKTQSTPTGPPDVEAA